MKQMATPPGPRQSSAEPIQEALKRDILFLERVTIEGANRVKTIQRRMSPQIREQLKKLEKKMIDEGAHGVGVKIDNPSGLACYELALRGCHMTIDPREKIALTSSVEGGIRELTTYLQTNDVADTIFALTNPAKHVQVTGIGIQLDGYIEQREFPTLATEKLQKQSEERDRRDSGRRLRSAKSVGEGFFVEHFVLVLPRRCFIETVPNRSIMCTASDSHMEGPGREGYLSTPVPIDYITRNQLAIVDDLIKKALQLNDESHLVPAADVPKFTRYYHMLRCMHWINPSASELNHDTLPNEKALVEICEELHNITDSVIATQTLLSVGQQTDLEEVMNRAGLSLQQRTFLLESRLLLPLSPEIRTTFVWLLQSLLPEERSDMVKLLQQQPSPQAKIDLVRLLQPLYRIHQVVFMQLLQPMSQPGQAILIQLLQSTPPPDQTKLIQLLQQRQEQLSQIHSREDLQKFVHELQAELSSQPISPGKRMVISMRRSQHREEVVEPAASIATPPLHRPGFG